MIVEKTWDFDLVVEFLDRNFSSPTHWPDWNLLVARHYETDFFYLLAREGGEIVGVCPVHATGYKRNLRKWKSGQTHFIPFGGWIFDRPTTVSPEAFPVRGNAYCHVATLPQLEAFHCTYPESAFTGRQGTWREKATLVIDLEPEIEAIWTGSVHSKRRNMVRKAGKRGVEIRQLETREEMDEFYAVYVGASRRNGLEVLPFPFFKALMEDCPNIRLDVLLAYKDGRQIANMAMICDKDYAIYWLGNNVADAPNDGQGELLQWEAIKLAKAVGCSYYDLCYIEPERLPGIYNFKKGFSQDQRSIAHLTVKPLLFKILNKIT